jgi:hypothetical protein
MEHDALDDSKSITSSYYFGASVTGIGDLDGDGVPDIAVGASQCHAFLSAGIWAGTGCDWYATNGDTSEESHIETYTGNSPESCLEAAREEGCEMANLHHGVCYCQYGSIDESVHSPCVAISFTDAVCTCNIPPTGLPHFLCEEQGRRKGKTGWGGGEWDFNRYSYNNFS